MIQSLTVDLQVLDDILHPDQASVMAHAGWTGLFVPGPRSELVLTASGGTDQLNTLITRTTSDQSGVGVLPAGASSVRQGDASEYLSWQSTKETRTSQTAFGRWIATDDGAAMPTTTSSFETGLALGFSRSFSHDTFGLNAGGSFLRFERIAPAGAMLGSRLDRQINPDVNAAWTHDFTTRWSMNLSGGVVYVNPVGTDPYNPTVNDRRAVPYPIAGGVLAYTEAWGRAMLSASHSVAPNLFIAQNTVSDTVLATVAMPLPWLEEHGHLRSPRFVGLATLGVDRTQLVDASAQLAGTFDVAHLDVGVGWTPSPGQTYSVRYELLAQRGDNAAAMVSPSFYRNTVFFTFSLRYPNDAMIKVPRRQDSVRSDRSDLDSIGEEPVVPDEAGPSDGKE